MATVIIGAAYFYYNSTQDRIERLVQNNAQLEENVNRFRDAVNQNEDTIDFLQNQSERRFEENQRLQNEMQVIRSQNNELRDRLSRHDIGALAFSRPGLVENRINNASQQALRCFELLSGSPLNESERNAENARAFNSECPWIFDERREDR